MRIKVSCPACCHRFYVSAEYLGRRVKCTLCRAPIRVTESSDDPEEEAEEPPRRAGASRPSAKRQTAKPGSGHGLAIGLGVGGGVVVLGLIVIVIAIVLTTSSGPKPAPVAATPETSASPTPPSPAIEANAVPLLAAAPVSAPAADVPPTTDAKSVDASTVHPPQAAPPAAEPTTTAETQADAKEAPATDGGDVAIPLPELQGVPAASTEKLELPELIRRVEPSVVRINVLSSEGTSVGSGFVVSTDGTVITNYHVITDAIKAEVEFENGVTGNVIGYRHVVPKADIAVIKIDVPAEKLLPIPIALELPQKGESVATFGNPHGLSFTTTEGTISALRKEADLKRDMGLDMTGTWLQFDAPISSGNSGGPLVDKYGRVVGINTMQLSVGQNLNFAVSAQEVVKALNEAPQDVKELKPENLPPVERGIARKLASEEYDTERGRRLFAEVKEIVLINATRDSNFDPHGEIWNRVITRSQRAVEKTGIELSYGRPRPDVAILWVMLEMNRSRKGTGGTQELIVSAELTCIDPFAKKDESPLAKVWKSQKNIGTISLGAAASGRIPRSVDEKLAEFFGSFRAAYNKAVKAIKEAKNSTADSPS